MYPAPINAAVAAVALVLVFSSSLAVCCICVRLAGRKRYRPASRDELLRAAILPTAVSSPDLSASLIADKGAPSWAPSRLTESIRRKLMRRRELVQKGGDSINSTAVVLNPASIRLATADVTLPDPSTQPAYPSYHDNAAYNSWETSSSSGIGSARSQDDSRSEVFSVAADFQQQQQQQSAAPRQHMLLTQVYIQSRETEL